MPTLLAEVEALLDDLAHLDARVSELENTCTAPEPAPERTADHG